MVLIIYKIVDNTTGKCYIGSTTKTLTKRLKRHEIDMMRWMMGKRNYITSFEILNNNDYQIELLEELEDYESRKQIEGRHIRENECVNKRIEGRTNQEIQNAHEEKRKHSDERKQYLKQHRGERIECVCGSIHRRGDIAQHKRSLKHTKHIESHKK